MDFCDFCHQPCGERRFCDEVCYQEYQDEMAAYMESMADANHDADCEDF
jgi:hypothetical protein